MSNKPKVLMIITLDLPPQQLKPNGRHHWRAKAAKVAEYREAACDAAMESAYHYGVMEPIQAPTVRITAYWPTTRRMDPDNLIATMKAAFDGITDAGVWRDDRDVTYLPCVQGKDKENPRIEIEVTSEQLQLQCGQSADRTD